MAFSNNPRNILKSIFVLLAFISAGFVVVPDTRAVTTTNAQGKGGFGTIKGVVRDDGGSPIADATVAFFRVGTSKLLKQVKSATDGSFLAKILPGTYTVLAVAQGFNPVSVSSVEVGRSELINYPFKLERAGSGNTLPEKRIDRNSSKWRIRAAQSQRSIYQNSEGDAPVDENAAAVEVFETAAEDENVPFRRGQTVVETYTAGSDDGMYGGFNFATLVPINEKAEVVFAGQTGTGRAPQRFETNLKFRPNDKHQVRINSSVGRLGSVRINGQEKGLGQVSFQALDEWRTRSGVIVVFGFDYSRFIGAGKDFSLSPRLGLQFDVNAKTRVRSAFTTQTEERTWAHAIELEDSEVIFRDPVAVEDIVVEHGKPRMNKSRRLEFGIERVLDNSSSIEGNVFFDTTLGRGVGLMSMSFDALGGEDFGDLVANQQGRSTGLRIVYTRRLNGMFSTSAGYAFGSGQKLSEAGITNPSEIFENDFFQSFYGQFDADLMKTGTHVRTVFRLSPQATVFAIDPFQGRLAIYDPGLSVMLTQSLPNLGLPFRAEAIVDARNLFDFQTGVIGDDGSLRLGARQRAVRGGILVRF